MHGGISFNIQFHSKSSIDERQSNDGGVVYTIQSLNRTGWNRLIVGWQLITFVWIANHKFYSVISTNSLSFRFYYAPQPSSVFSHADLIYLSNVDNSETSGSVSDGCLVLFLAKYDEHLLAQYRFTMAIDRSTYLMNECVEWFGWELRPIGNETKFERILKHVLITLLPPYSGVWTNHKWILLLIDITFRITTYWKLSTNQFIWIVTLYHIMCAEFI